MIMSLINLVSPIMMYKGGKNISYNIINLKFKTYNNAINKVFIHVPYNIVHVVLDDNLDFHLLHLFKS